MKQYHTLDIIPRKIFNKKHLQDENMIYPTKNHGVATKKIKISAPNIKMHLRISNSV